MATNDARPVEGDERLVLLDVIRGFALGGVCVSNAYAWFSGRAFLPRERFMDSLKLPLDAAAGFVVNVFVQSRFVTIFTFLFGLGFAVQLARADARGASGAALYARRLGVMLLLAAVHFFAIWYGDILHVYAVFGFVLLLFRRRSDRTVLAWGIALTFVAPALFMYGIEFLPRLFRSPEQIKAIAAASMAAHDQVNARALELFSGTSFLAVLRYHPTIQVTNFLSIHAMPFYIETLGKMLLGYYFGRVGLLHDVPRYRRLFRHLLGWGLLAGVIGNVAFLLIRFLLAGGGRPPQDNLILSLARPVLLNLAVVGLSTFYVALIALLFQRNWWRRLLSLLAPAGQMALTNYLTQSVIAVFIFYGIGLGLAGKARPIWCLLIPMGVFTVQIVWSHIWLAYFRFGPMEWVWRSLTYGKAQPMRKTVTAMSPPSQSTAE